MPELPLPAYVRALNLSRGQGKISFDRPPPVTFPSLGLLVKYGGNVTVTEALTQIMIHERLREEVPVPEVFGWAKDGGQTFIYMSLIEGDTLNQRWPTMTENERQDICLELKHMVKAWRALEQDGNCRFVGSLGKEPLNEIFLRGYNGLAGPFEGSNAVQQFHDACGIEIKAETPIRFTHADIVPPNIILSPAPNTKVVAILDWG
ncbi:phosphotransferase family protein [Xylariales sp. PMI_506]|nr:phosphotransferase family protein [Xylariales sp. PMI_506]